MRLEVLPGSAVDGAPERWLGAILCRDVIGEDGRALLVKGSRLGPGDTAILVATHPAELHLLWLDDGDVGEDAAAVRIAAAVAGPGATTRPPVESQVRLVSAWRGLVSVDVAALSEVNLVDGVTVFTVPDGLPVDAGRTLAGVKITPLAIAETSVEAAERAAASARDRAGVVHVRPFLPLRMAAIVRQHLTDDARARFERSIAMRSAWYGGAVASVRYVDDDAEQVQDALRVAAASADVVLAVGVASVDPLEVTWQSLLAAGATSLRRGLPMHPGSSYWIAELLGSPVIGVASCGMFSRRSALDLLLARLHAGLPLDPAYLASLGHGGLLGKEAAWRIPSYEAALDAETDEG
ncbi:MAG: molybdopterin-binding protein [Candidatus Dormiibacterota bacterium]